MTNIPVQGLPNPLQSFSAAPNAAASGPRTQASFAKVLSQVQQQGQAAKSSAAAHPHRHHGHKGHAPAASASAANAPADLTELFSELA